MADVGPVFMDVGILVSIAVAVVGWVQALAARRSADAARDHADAADVRAERSAKAAEESAQAAARSDERGALQLARSTERNDVRWYGRWIEPYVWTVLNCGTDDAHKVRMELIVDGSSPIVEIAQQPVRAGNPQVFDMANGRMEFGLAVTVGLLKSREKELRDDPKVAFVSTGLMPIKLRCHWETPHGSTHSCEIETKIPAGADENAKFQELVPVREA